MGDTPPPPRQRALCLLCLGTRTTGLGTPRMLAKSFVVPKVKGSKFGDLRIWRILSKSTWFLGS